MADPVRRVDTRNRLLALLSDGERSELGRNLETVPMPRGLVLSKPGVVAEFCYFPESGLGSVVAQDTAGQKAEVGLFGWDGMSSCRQVLDLGAGPHTVLMQIAGEGRRIPSAALVGFARACPGFRNLLIRYNQVVATQAAYTALSNAVDHVDKRLARWILMCHDRTSGNEIALTHDFLAIMLAIRRASVTEAIHRLEGKLLIYGERSLITVRDRRKLEKYADGAYGASEAEYALLVRDWHVT